MSIIIDYDHEAGNLGEYSGTVIDGGDLSADAAAALAGTSYGLQCVIDDTTGIYGYANLGSNNTSGRIRFRFYIDPNTLTMGNNEEFWVAYARTSAVGSIVDVALRYTTVGGYFIYAKLTIDTGSVSTSAYGITDAPHYIEVDVIRATNSTSNDGSLQLWIDGVSKETLSSRDNYDSFANLRYFYFGAITGIDAGTNGTLFLDELVVNDDGSEIGPVSTSGSDQQPAYTKGKSTNTDSQVSYLKGQSTSIDSQSAYLKGTDTYCAKVGSFNIDTSKTAGQTQAISGLGFEPKIVLFWWSGSTGTGDTVAGGNINAGFGAAVSTSSRFNSSYVSLDGVAASDTWAAQYTTECIRIYSDGAGTVDGLADFSSFDVDGFTLVIDDQFANAYRISYLALGGTDLTNVYIGNKAMPTSTGNYDVTDVGFQPDAVIFSGAISTAASGTSASAQLYLGIATGASNQGVCGVYSNSGATTTNTFGYSYNGENMVRTLAESASYREAFVEFLSNGFRINHLEGTTSAWTYHYIALKGGQYSVGDLTTRTDGNDISETVGFQPIALLFASANRALSTQDTPSDHARLSIGAGTSTSNRAVQAISEEDNLADTETAYTNYDSAVYAHVADDAIVALMDIKSIDASGFTCVMDDAEAGACWVTYLAIGRSPTSGSDTQPAYTKGKSTNTDSQVSYLSGKATNTDSQSCYLRGQQTIPATSHVIVDINHESGNLTEYTSTVEDSGDLSAAAAAALAGTSYGLQCVIDDSTAIYGRATVTTNTSGVVRARFYFDPNTLSMANLDTFYIFVFDNSSSQGFGGIKFRYQTDGGYILRAYTTNDSAAEAEVTVTGVTDAPHYIEIKITKSSGANDGTMDWWIDGSAQTGQTGLDNDTRFANFSYVRVGAVAGLDAGTSGTFFLDEIVVNDDGSEIGPVPWVPAYTRGQDTSTDSQSAYLRGQATLGPTQQKTFTDGYGGDVTTYKDTYLRKDESANNFGGSTNFFIGRIINDDIICHTLIKFDVSSIDAGATIDSATMSLYVNDNSVTYDSTQVDVYDLTSANGDWVEGTASGAQQTGSSCWQTKIYNTDNWAGSQGASTAGTDYVNTILGTGTVPTTPTTGEEMAISLSTTAVGAWRSTNYGQLIKGKTESGSNVGGNFCSSDHATTGYRPKLVVVYSELIRQKAYLNGKASVADSQPCYLRGQATLGPMQQKTFTDGYGGDVNTAFDTYTSQWDPTSSLNGSTVEFRGTGAGAVKVGLFKFNLSSIPSGSTCDSANLYLYASGDSTSSATINLYPILSANSGWLETCNWNYADGAGESDRWAGDTGNDGGSDAGCSVSGTDYSGSSMGSFTIVNAEAAGTEKNVSLTTTVVDDWFGSNDNNFGICGQSSYAFMEQEVCSSDHPTTGYRPKLVVVYTELIRQRAYLAGKDTNTDSQSAYLNGASAGGQETDQQPSYLVGQDISTDQQSAYISGQLSILDNQSTYLQGQAETQSDVSAFLTGRSDISDAVSAFLTGQQAIQDQTPAYLVGQASTLSQVSSYLRGSSSAIDQQPVYLYGVEHSTDNISAFLLGDAIETDSIHAFMQVEGGIQDQQPAYLSAKSIETDNQPSYLIGSEAITNNQGSYLFSQAFVLDNQPAFTQGKAEQTDQQASYLYGVLHSTDNIPAYLIGKATITDSQPAFLLTEGAALDNQPAYLLGIEWQYLYPDADITVGEWINETSGSELYVSIDDEEINDSDYVWHQDVQVNDYFEVRLSDLAYAVGEGPISIEWRAEALVGGVTIKLKLELREGETVIASDEQTLSTSFTNYVYVLTQEEIDSVDNWNSVTIRVTATEVS